MNGRKSERAREKKKHGENEIPKKTQFSNGVRSHFCLAGNEILFYIGIEETRIIENATAKQQQQPKLNKCV